MGKLHETIDAILSDRSIDGEEGESARAEEIERLVAEYSWAPVQDCLFDILRDDSRSTDEWEVVGAVFWSAVLDKRKISANEAIALLYYRLPLDSMSDESNLAWSIASELKGIGYLSDYDPLSDPEVQRYLPKADGA